MSNEIVIIGGDHCNTLGMIRVFGIHKIKPIVIIITHGEKKKNMFCYKSKFLKRFFLVGNESEALNMLYSMKFDEKPVLIPTSDGAALMIDNNYNSLKNSFLLPGINNIQGEIARLMDKKNQAEWAESAGIKVAKTNEYDIKQRKYVSEYPNIDFPCVLKPVISAEGDKADICISSSKEDFEDRINIFEHKGYSRILVQEYIKKNYEMELFGSILKNNDVIPFILTKHYREYPFQCGSVCLHEYINDDNLKKQAYDILHKIKALGFNGNIDIELFYVDGTLMLNEINFRNSGDIYACFRNKVYYAYYWYLDLIKAQNIEYNVTYDSKFYAMREDLDFKYVLNKKLKFKEWLKYYNKTGDFAYKFKDDMAPYRKKIRIMLRHFLFRKKGNKV